MKIDVARESEGIGVIRGSRHYKQSEDTTFPDSSCPAPLLSIDVSPQPATLGTLSAPLALYSIRHNRKDDLAVEEYLARDMEFSFQVTLLETARSLI